MAEACPVNIGPKQRRMRRNVGIVAGVATLAGTVAIFLVPLHGLWAAALTIPAFVAALGWLQASAGT